VAGPAGKDGVGITDHPVVVMDLPAVMMTALRINLDTHYRAPFRQPTKTVDGGQPIKELFG
jgi:hypothetical protein